MVYFEDNNSNAAEVDGIRFKTLMSKRVLQIPRSEPGAKTTLQFGIQITNNTENSHRFLLFFARPEFFQADKQKLQRFSPNVNGSYNPEVSDFKLLAPLESVSILLLGYFCSLGQ
ncbi:hypothetical protein NIES4071_79320 [Calothrix sp. NIES-4071]|nr:hypothetical protein NIES4071_79320 [Calothrix sp. NIES-4071]BAZ62202.1 hypothetical protein NIES4105_79250 [Calothrix sp. NIES-4105]